MDACAGAGFASVAKFTGSCKASGFFESLQAARARAVNLFPSVDYTRGMARAYAIDAGQAARDLQAFGSMGGWRDAFATDGQRARLARRAVVRDLLRALDGAQVWRGRAARLVAANLAAFGQVLAGIHSDKFGDLRRVFGLVDKRGRGRSSRADATGIRRASGKLARGIRLAPTVSVTLESGKSLDCAPSVGVVHPSAMGGAAGFAIVNPRG